MKWPVVGVTLLGAGIAVWFLTQSPHNHSSSGVLSPIAPLRPPPARIAAPIRQTPPQPTPFQPTPPALPEARLRAAPAPHSNHRSVYGTEVGIPILMFHRFEAHARSTFTLTPAVFAQILEKLQRAGYCAVSLEEYLGNRFPLACGGLRPVALTFDDSHPTQVALLNDGSLDPNSGLGVLLRAWPGARATFFANVRNGGHPFGRDSAKKVALLERLGFTIGNHTVSHARLDRLSAAGVKRELSGVCRYFGRTQMLLAYPYGVIPMGATPVPTALPGCAISAAFGAESGYFEGRRPTGRSLLAPLPGTSAFKTLRWRIPRLNISGLDDLRRDVLENPNVYRLPSG